MVLCSKSFYIQQFANNDGVLIFVKTYPVLVLLFNHFFRKNFHFQFSLSFIFFFFLLSNISSNLVTTLLFFEILFYLVLYSLIHEMSSRIFENNSFKYSSIMFPLVLINFFGSWFFFAYINLHINFFASSDNTLSVFLTDDLKLFLLLVFFLKINFGPWYFNNSPIYTNLPINLLLFYIYLYFFFIIPSFFNIVHFENFAAYVFLFLSISTLILSKEFLYCNSFKKFLLYSSFFTYIFVIVLLCFFI